MGYKIFLDINVVVDFFVSSRGDNKNAVSLIEMIEDEVHYGYISETVVNTTNYLVRKSSNAEKFRLLMDEFVTITTVLPCSNLTIHEAYKKQKVDLEDSVLYQLALENQLDYFITSNISDFTKISHISLPVLTAGQFLSIVNH